MAEDAFGSRLESLIRTLLGVVEQHAYQATRIEALIGILRKVEDGQIERETEFFRTQGGHVGLSQLILAHLLGVVESSPRAEAITQLAQARLRALRGES